MKNMDGKIGVVIVIAVLALVVCGLGPGVLNNLASSSSGQPASTPTPDYYSSSSGDQPGPLAGLADFWNGLFAPSPEKVAEAERIRRLADVQVEATRAHIALITTLEWEKAHPTVTPTPPPTSTPQPSMSNFVASGTGMANRIFVSALVGGLVLAIVLAGYYGAMILKRESETYQRTATGAAIKLPDGTVAMTNKAIGPTITPQPRPDKSWLVKLDRLLHYLKTGEIKEFVPAPVPLLNDAKASSKEYTAIAMASAQADGIAAAMSSGIDEQTRLARMEMLRGNYQPHAAAGGNPNISVSTPTPEAVGGPEGYLLRAILARLGLQTPQRWQLAAPSQPLPQNDHAAMQVIESDADLPGAIIGA